MIAHLIELFAVGEILFWIALCTFGVILTSISEKTYHGIKLFLIGGTIALLYPLLKQIDIKAILAISVFYIIFGAIFSLIKWFRHTKNVIEENSNFLKNHKITCIKDLDDIDIEYGSNDYRTSQSLEEKLNPTENKERICNWTFYWPWSILRMLTADLAETVFEMIKKQYHAIVNNMLASNIKRS